MKIVIVTPEFITEDYFGGGQGVAFARLAESFVRRGHSVRVIVESDEPRSPIEHRGAQVEYLPPARRLNEWADRLTHARYAKASRFVGWAWAVYRRLGALRREDGMDVAQFSSMHAPGLFAIPLLRMPHTVFVAGYLPLWNTAGRVPLTPDVKMAVRIENLQYRFSRHIYASSRYLIGEMKRDLPLREAEAIPFPVFLDTDREDDSVLRSRLGGLEYLLFVGRLERHKGVFEIARILRALLEKHPALRFVFVGQDMRGVSRERMSDDIRELASPHEGRVIFIEPLRHPRLFPIIRGARLVTLPSLMENISNVSVEAMALGRPVIGTIGRSFDEIITHGVNGFLCRPDDPADLLRVIEEALARADLEAIGREAAKIVERLSESNCTDRLLALYERLVARQRAVEESA